MGFLGYSSSEKRVSMVIPPGRHFSISAGVKKAQPAGKNRKNARRTDLGLTRRPSSHQKLK